MPRSVKTTSSGTNENTNRDDEEKASLEAPQITMDKRVDLAVSVFFVLVGVFILIASRNIRAGSVHDPITSRGMPYITGFCLIIVGIALTVQQLLIWPELPGHLVPEEGQADEKGHPSSWARAVSIVFLSVIWQWLLEPLGFLFITPLYLVACSWVMAVRSWTKIIGFSIIFSVATWVIFGPMLGMRLPLGPLEPFARSLGLIL